MLVKNREVVGIWCVAFIKHNCKDLPKMRHRIEVSLCKNVITLYLTEH